jgi:hypothetical protein
MAGGPDVAGQADGLAGALLGHVGSHAGEMIATRNRMGLSPF